MEEVNVLKINNNDNIVENQDDDLFFPGFPDRVATFGIKVMDIMQVIDSSV